MNETTENFLQAINAWQQTAPESQAVTYRLYYDENGQPICYSMEELDGNYVEITAEQFARSDAHVVVREGKIHAQPLPLPAHLVPAESGTACVSDDVSIVATAQQPHVKWSLKSQ